MQGQRVCVCVEALPSPTEAQSQLSCPEMCSGTCYIKFLLTGLVKAVNTAVDLIVAHFGTSRDPGVKVGEKPWRAEFCPADPHLPCAAPSLALLHLEPRIDT